MLPDIPGNFIRKYERKGEDGLKCKHCSESEILKQSHCLDCSAGEEYRGGLDTGYTLGGVLQKDAGEDGKAGSR